MLLTDTNDKTARIPVKYIDGKFINQITGEAVAGIVNEAYCEIVVEANKVFDYDLLNLLMDEEIIEILPPETVLYASINSEHTPANLRKFAIKPTDIHLNEKERFVAIRLIEPLMLKFRGTKQPSLLDCKCDIPALTETDETFEPGESLNHAYRLISTAFEPHRRAFGGSVFLKVFYRSQEAKERWMKLKDLRENKIQDYYNKLTERYQEMKKNSEETSLFPESSFTK